LNHCAEVSGFSTKLGKLREVPIVSAALAYDCPTTLQTYILIFHQSLYIPDITSHLICPNQLRQNGITVNDCPLQYQQPTLRQRDSHSILIGDIRIPLHMRGVISTFSVRCPTEREMFKPNVCLHIEMTSPSTWNPYDEELNINEEALSLSTLPPYDERQINLFNSSQTNTFDIHDSPTLATSLQRNILVTLSHQSTRKGTVSARDLAQHWFIGLNTAQRTIERSTQRGVRDIASTSGYRRLKHRAHQLMYRHIRATVYTDTMFNRVKSIRQNTCAQVYVTKFHWTKAYPMRTKADAHLTLDQLHSDIGVFHTVVPDNAPELISGEFRKKLIHAGSQIKPVEAYTHNQNMDESAIRELRRMYRKAMISTNAPHILWDHCITLMAEIRSNTAIDLPELDGDTPLTRITGDTPDISHLCEFKWYDTVWYVDPQQNGKS
jgi:hypothetical protein